MGITPFHYRKESDTPIHFCTAFRLLLFGQDLQTRCAGHCRLVSFRFGHFSRSHRRNDAVIVQQRLSCFFRSFASPCLNNRPAPPLHHLGKGSLMATTGRPYVSLKMLANKFSRNANKSICFKLRLAPSGLHGETSSEHVVLTTCSCKPRSFGDSHPPILRLTPGLSSAREINASTRIAFFQVKPSKVTDDFTALLASAFNTESNSRLRPSGVRANLSEPQAAHISR